MDVSSVIVLGIIILVILSLIMLSTEMFLPIQIKLEMIGLLRPYLLLIESEGQLNENETELVASLEAIHLKNVTVELSNHTKFGDLLEFKVSGDYHWDPIITLGLRENRIIEMTYERKIFIRKITN